MFLNQEKWCDTIKCREHYRYQTDMDTSRPNIIIIGIGGAGCRTIHTLHSMRTADYPLIAADSDSALLAMINSDEKIFLHSGDGQKHTPGTAGFYRHGIILAGIKTAEIRETLSGCDLCILTYGLGGGTGTAGGPAVARLAKEEGATVFSIVSYPFCVEKRHIRNVGIGLEALIEWSDTVIIQDFNCLIEYFTVPLADHLARMDGMNAGCIDTLCACLSQERAVVPLVYEDLIDILKRGGFGYTYAASLEGSSSPEEIGVECMKHPYLHLSGVSVNDLLILIERSSGLGRDECEEIVSRIGAQFGEYIGIGYGACVDNKTDAVIEVTVIAMTGERSPDVFRDFPHYGLKPMGNILF